jgi:hypothetical protein
MEAMITDDDEVQSAISKKNPKRNSTKNQQVIKYRDIPKILICAKLLKKVKTSKHSLEYEKQ